MRVFIFYIVCLFAGLPYVQAQKSIVHFRYFPNPARIRELNRTTINVSIYKFIPYEGKKIYGQTELEKGITDVSFYSLPADSLILEIKASNIYDNEIPIRFEIAGREIVTKKNSIDTITILYPPDCEYYNNRNRKVCPACKKADKVIPIVYGFLVIDPVEIEDKNSPLKGPYYEGGCEVTGCDPNWYCERDKNKF